ncbi:MAG TPA: hypothetical protein VF097_12145 [Actinomycetota bacterium]
MSIAQGPSWGGNRMRNVLAGTAILELVLGVGFLIAGRSAGAGATGLTVTGAILAATGLLLLLWARSVGTSQRRAQQIVATGLPGTATIESFRQTGVALNEINPQVEMDLEVHVEGRDPYMVKKKEFIPGAMVGILTSGAALPVRVDPDDLSQVVVLWGAQDASAAQGTDPVELQRQIDERRAKVRENPLPATARFRKAKDTGVRVGDYRIMEIEVQIEVDDGRPPHVDSGHAAVPSAVADRVRPGLELPAQIRRDDPNLFFVDWDQVPTL